MEQRHSTSQSSTCDVYRSLKEISAITFHEIKFSGNIYLLDKDYNENKTYSTKDVIYISDTWSRLYDEYFEKTDDTRFRKELKNRKRSLDLLLEINIIQSILRVLVSIEENDGYVPNEAFMPTIVSLGNSLKKLNRKINFDSTRPLIDNIKNVQGFVGGLQTRYEINFKEDLVVEEKDILFYYEITQAIASVLDMDYIPDHINMLQYIAYEKRYKKKLRHEQQHQRRKTSRGTG